MNKNKHIEQEIKSKGSWQLPISNSLNWSTAFKRTLELVKDNIPVVLFGPPGTGKTKIINHLKKELSDEKLLGNFEIVQFHKKFSYEDFIEGYSPTEKGGFEKKAGIFKMFCERRTDKKVDLFVIDEMNRAELSSTLGEVLYTLEDRGERSVKTSHFGDTFRIPRNLSLVGTMNTADRNINVVDYALRRRFRFVAVNPDSDELNQWLNKVGFGFTEFSIAQYIKYFEILNYKIQAHQLLGAQMRLGQSFFVPPRKSDPISSKEIIHNFSEVIGPQLEAYLGNGNEMELSLLLNPVLGKKITNYEQITIEDLASHIHEAIGTKRNV